MPLRRGQRLLLLSFRGEPAMQLRRQERIFFLSLPLRLSIPMKIHDFIKCSLCAARCALSSVSMSLGLLELIMQSTRFFINTIWRAPST